MLRTAWLAKAFGVSVVGASLCLWGGNVEAAEKWEWTLAPYLWLSDVGMDVAIDSEPVIGADIEFSDLIDKVDAAFQLHFEGRRGKPGFFVDLTLLSLSDDLTVPGGGPAGLPAGSTIDVDITLTIIEGAGFYRVTGQRGGLDVLFGVRNLELDQELDFADPAGAPLTKVSLAPSFTDGFLGLRYLGRLPNDKWGYDVRADYGFGDTEGTLNLLAVAHYGFGKTGKYGLLFGWRAMDIEIEATTMGVGVDTDLTMSGPVVAFVIRFGR
jgi:hypothetical protein